MPYCPNCHLTLEGYENYCERCGEPIKKEDEDE